jgi:hypothetical protein
VRFRAQLAVRIRAPPRAAVRFCRGQAPDSGHLALVARCSVLPALLPSRRGEHDAPSSLLPSRRGEHAARAAREDAPACQPPLARVHGAAPAHARLGQRQSCQRRFAAPAPGLWLRLRRAVVATRRGRREHKQSRRRPPRAASSESSSALRRAGHAARPEERARAPRQRTTPVLHREPAHRLRWSACVRLRVVSRPVRITKQASACKSQAPAAGACGSCSRCDGSRRLLHHGHRQFGAGGGASLAL